MYIALINNAYYLDFIHLRGLSVGYKGTLFIFDMNYSGHEDLKKKKKNWGCLCKVVLQGGPFERVPR